MGKKRLGADLGGEPGKSPVGINCGGIGLAVNEDAGGNRRRSIPRAAIGAKDAPTPRAGKRVLRGGTRGSTRIAGDRSRNVGVRRWLCVTAVLSAWLYDANDSNSKTQSGSAMSVSSCMSMFLPTATAQTIISENMVRYYIKKNLEKTFLFSPRKQMLCVLIRSSWLRRF